MPENVNVYQSSTRRANEYRQLEFCVPVLREMTNTKFRASKFDYDGMMIFVRQKVPEGKEYRFSNSAKNSDSEFGEL